LVRRPDFDCYGRDVPHGKKPQLRSPDVMAADERRQDHREIYFSRQSVCVMSVTNQFQAVRE
jgi:hypothetical protein